MHNVDFCWYTCFWIHKYIQVQNCGPWGVPCSHCFCNSVKSTWWEWKIMCWGRVGDYEYLAKYSGKFQKYFSNQVNKRIHPPNFQAFATSLRAAYYNWNARATCYHFLYLSVPKQFEAAELVSFGHNFVNMRDITTITI